MTQKSMTLIESWPRLFQLWSSINYENKNSSWYRTEALNIYLINDLKYQIIKQGILTFSLLFLLLFFFELQFFCFAFFSSFGKSLIVFCCILYGTLFECKLLKSKNKNCRYFIGFKTRKRLSGRTGVGLTISSHFLDPSTSSS